MKVIKSGCNKIILCIICFFISLCFTGCGKYNGEIANINIENYDATGLCFFVNKNASYKNELIEAVNFVIEELGHENIEILIKYHNDILDHKTATLPDSFPDFPDLTNFSEVLVVYNSVDGPPFSYYGPNNSVAGVEIDILKFAASRLQRKIETRTCTFGSIFNNVNANSSEWRISGIGVANTEERRESVEFCNPHWTMTLNIISKSSDSFCRISELNGKKIGVYIGESGDVFVKQQKNNGVLSADTQVIEYPTPQTAFYAFLTNKVDAVVCLDYVADALIRYR